MTWTDTQEQNCQVEIMLVFRWIVITKMHFKAQDNVSDPSGQTPILKSQQNL